MDEAMIIGLEGRERLPFRPSCPLCSYSLLLFEPESIRAALALHRQHGTTRSVISLVANPVPSRQTSGNYQERTMDRLSVVRNVAKTLKLLDANGKLIELDSLGQIDFVTALEKATRVHIPAAMIRQDVFESLESIASMLDDI